MITPNTFSQHSTGVRFSDVLNDVRFPFQDALDFFNRPDVRKRMRESELHHDRPAFGGVVREFERIPSIDAFLRNHDAHTTRRGRQAVGVMILIAMTQEGWVKSGRKGALGRRAKVDPHTTTPGAYINVSGLSRWFTQTERYEPSPNHPDFAFWKTTP